MAGCDAHNLGGNNDAGINRVVSWVIALIIVGAIVGLLNGAGFVWWAALALMALGAAAGGGLGFFLGQAYAWFGRLKAQSPSQITISGTAACFGRNPWGLQPWTDGDWTANIANLVHHLPADLAITVPGAATKIEEVRLRAAPGSGLQHAFPSFNEEAHKIPTLHCEISAHQGSYSVVGGAVGSVAGGIAGGVIGAVLCVAFALATFGIGAALCAILIAAGIALGVWAGGAAGETIGAAIGWIVDEVGDFDKLGKTIETHSNCTLFITGDWVTDISHEHNEIHEITGVQITNCQPRPDTSIPVPRGPGVALTVTARKPAGNDPPPIK